VLREKKPVLVEKRTVSSEKKAAIANGLRLLGNRRGAFRIDERPSETRSATIRKWKSLLRDSSTVLRDSMTALAN
jgi:hypothetical protein